MRKTVLIAVLAMTGCTTAAPVFPTEVTRFRADTVERGTISLVPDEVRLDGPAFQNYAAAVGDALAAQGYTVVPSGVSSAYIARIGFQSDTRSVRGPAPFTLGLGVGGGSYGRGGGVDAGVSGGIPIGKREMRDDTAATLSVRISRRAGDLGVWEGKAQTRLIRRAGTGDANAIAAKLADAMFRGFPGESGRTITVK